MDIKAVIHTQLHGLVQCIEMIILLPHILYRYLQFSHLMSKFLSWWTLDLSSDLNNWKHKHSNVQSQWVHPRIPPKGTARRERTSCIISIHGIPLDTPLVSDSFQQQWVPEPAVLCWIRKGVTFCCPQHHMDMRLLA